MFGNRTASAVSILQKTYDESYLTCSTAVYYESQVYILRAFTPPRGARTTAADLQRAGKRRRGYAMLATGPRANIRPQCQQSSPQLHAAIRDREGPGRQHSPARAAV